MNKERVKEIKDSIEFRTVIANQFNVDDELLQEEVELFNAYEKLQQENKQLKDNWNKLKEIAKSQSGFKKQVDLKGGLWFEIDDLLDKMQELEQGSDE